MIDVPRPRPPYLHRETTRHGKTVWYVRVDKGPRFRIRAQFGAPEFDAEYQAAVSGQPQRPRGTAVGTLPWLIERYRETTAWTDLSLATRRYRENIFQRVLQTAGDLPFAKITKAAIIAVVSGGFRPRLNPVNSSTLCADYFAGRQAPVW